MIKGWRIWSFFDNAKNETKEENSRFNAKLLTLMPTASLRHSTTLVPEIELFGEIGRMTGNRWSNSAMLDFWFVVDRFYFCHIENSRNPTLSFNLFSVSYFLYDWMLPVQQRLKFISMRLIDIFITFDHKDFVKLKTLKKIVSEIFDAIFNQIFTSHFDDGYFSIIRFPK